MNNENLTAEFREKARGKTAEELVELAQDEGVELTDEQLEAVSGGWNGRNCPNCGSDNCGMADDDAYNFGCFNCGYQWK